MPDIYGWKLSKPEKDVKTVTGDDLIMEADYTMIKVLTAGSGMFQYSDGLVAVQHNLGYIPQFLVYADIGDNGDMQLLTGSQPVFEVESFAYADATNVYFMVAPSSDVLVYYYIFHDQT